MPRRLWIYHHRYILYDLNLICDRWHAKMDEPRAYKFESVWFREQPGNQEIGLLRIRDGDTRGA